MSTQTVASKKKSIITINKNFCTGCGICVDVCPENVLGMTDEPSKVTGQIACVKNLEACTKCTLCEIHCPDFAITVN